MIDVVQTLGKALHYREDCMEGLTAIILAEEAFKRIEQLEEQLRWADYKISELEHYSGDGV